jgi:hypothetical protein
MRESSAAAPCRELMTAADLKVVAHIITVGCMEIVDAEVIWRVPSRAVMRVPIPDQVLYNAGTKMSDRQGDAERPGRSAKVEIAEILVLASLRLVVPHPPRSHRVQPSRHRKTR